jgi:hypothetical protein
MSEMEQKMELVAIFLIFGAEFGKLKRKIYNYLQV